MTLSPVVAATYQFDKERLIAQALPLLQFPWLVHGSTTRHFSPANANRAYELHHLRSHLQLSLDVPIFHAEQKHTSNVGVVRPEHLQQLTDDNRHVFPQTDAIVCPMAKVMIAILTADCAPVFFVDPVTRIIALTHAGWKGTLARIVQKTVEQMTRLGSERKDIVTWVGPMIGGCCYEVSPEMVEQFQSEFREATDHGITIAKGRNLDLVALNTWQLQDAGVAPEHIHQSGICTLDQKDTFYSYRGDSGTTGRIISAMAIAEK